MTALMWSSKEGHHGVVRALLAAGVNTEAIGEVRGCWVCTGWQWRRILCDDRMVVVGCLCAGGEDVPLDGQREGPSWCCASLVGCRRRQGGQGQGGWWHWI